MAKLKFYIEEKTANGIVIIGEFDTYTDALKYKENPKHEHKGLWTIGLKVGKK